MPEPATVDVNLFVYNGAATVSAAVESVLAQTWPALAVTLIDDGSTDGTWDILKAYASRHPSIRLHRNRCNGGAIANFQRAFWFGDSDYVMPKSGDDVIAPDFIERIMTVLLDDPDCAMCHASGLVFRGERHIEGYYPPEHRLLAVGPDPLARARHVMQRYTSSPSFWGVYRRAASDRLSPIRYRAGWDHVLLAELALYGGIRHVPEPLYWRRDGGKPVGQLARAATLQARVGLPLDDVLAEQRWRMPLITTAYAHMEMATAAPLPLASRLALMRDVPSIFRDRWLPQMQQEAAGLRAALPRLLQLLRMQEPTAAQWLAHSIAETLDAAGALVPDTDLSLERLEIAASTGEPRMSAAA